MYLEKEKVKSEFDEAVRRAAITLAAELLTYSYDEARESIRGARVLLEGGDFVSLPSHVRRLGAAFSAHLPQEHPAAAARLLKALETFIDYAETGVVDLRSAAPGVNGYIVSDGTVDAVRSAPLRLVK